MQQPVRPTRRRIYRFLVYVETCLSDLRHALTGTPRTEEHAVPRDEAYVLDLCDQVLGAIGLRQHRFDFLKGDPCKRGRCVKLPVDAYYPNLRLVIEYRERQHSEPVAIMDRRLTISGCSRGEQRRRYDERRRVVLREQGIGLVELDYRMFGHNKAKRLQRLPDDAIVVARALASYRG